MCHLCYNYHLNVSIRSNLQNSAHAQPRGSSTLTTSFTKESIIPVFTDGNRCPFCRSGVFNSVTDQDSQLGKVNCSAFNLCVLLNKENDTPNRADTDPISPSVKPEYLVRMPYWAQKGWLREEASVVCCDSGKCQPNLEIFIKGSGVRSPMMAHIYDYHSKDLASGISKKCSVWILEESTVEILVVSEQKEGKKSAQEPTNMLNYSLLYSNDSDGRSKSTHPENKTNCKLQLNKYASTAHRYLYARIQLSAPKYTDAQRLSASFQIEWEDKIRRKTVATESTLLLEFIPKVYPFGVDTPMRNVSNQSTHKNMLYQFQHHGALALWGTHLDAGQNLLFNTSLEKKQYVKMLLANFLNASQNISGVSEFDPEVSNRADSSTILSRLVRYLKTGYAPVHEAKDFSFGKEYISTLFLPTADNNFLHHTWVCQRENSLKEILLKLCDSRPTDNTTRHLVVVHDIDIILSHLFLSDSEARRSLFTKPLANRPNETVEIQWIWTISCPLHKFLSFVLNNLGHMDIFQPSKFGLWSPLVLQEPRIDMAKFSAFDLSAPPRWENHRFGLQMKTDDFFYRQPSSALHKNEKSMARKRKSDMSAGLSVVAPVRETRVEPHVSTELVHALSAHNRRFLQNLLHVYIDKRDPRGQVNMQVIRDGMRSHGHIYPDKEFQSLRKELETHSLLECKKDCLKFPHAEVLWKALKDVEKKDSQ